MTPRGFRLRRVVMPFKPALLPLLAALVLAARPVAARQTVPARLPDSTQRVRTHAAAVPHDSGETRILPVASPFRTSRLRLEPVLRRSRAGHAVIGGLIGGVTGVLVCTAISNFVKDSGTGFSTCTTSGYTGFILGGVALGAAIGALVK